MYDNPFRRVLYGSVKHWPSADPPVPEDQLAEADFVDDEGYAITFENGRSESYDIVNIEISLGTGPQVAAQILRKLAAAIEKHGPQLMALRPCEQARIVKGWPGIDVVPEDPEIPGIMEALPADCCACESNLPADENRIGAEVVDDKYYLCPQCWAKVERPGRKPEQTITAVIHKRRDPEVGGSNDPLDAEDYEDLRRLGLHDENDED